MSSDSSSSPSFIASERGSHLEITSKASFSDSTPSNPCVFTKKSLNEASVIYPLSTASSMGVRGQKVAVVAVFVTAVLGELPVKRSTSPIKPNSTLLLLL